MRVDQRVEPHAGFQDREETQGALHPVGQRPQERAPEGQAPHEGGEDGGVGVGADADELEEIAAPEDLVAEPHRAGDQEEQEDEALGHGTEGITTPTAFLARRSW
jgi:hypothetical protein